MGRIGNLGKLIVFEVSGSKVLTFDKMTQSIKGRWAVQEPILTKPYPEFLGPGQRTITLPIYLSAIHGVSPRKTMEQIEKAVEDGTPFPLVIGNRKVGSYQWVITELSETWGEIVKDGILVSASLTLNLAEYR